MSAWTIVATCARQELMLSVRSRWVQTFAAVFGALALLVALAGYVLSGGSGLQDFARTAASLVQLVLLLVPLTSLLFGVVALTPDAGAAELLYSQPVARRTLLVGRLAGLWLALAAAQAIGFGAAGLVLFARTGEGGLAGFVALVLGGLALTSVFLSLAALVAVGDTSRRRARAIAVALAVWFVAVVLFDVAVLGVASMLASGPASRLLILSVIANPVDAVRTGALLAIEGTSAFGGASLAFFRFTGGAGGALAWLAGAIALWIVVPLALATARLARADI